MVSPQCGGTPAVLPATTTGLFVAWLPASSKITSGEVIRYTWYGIHTWSMATVVAAVSVLLLPGCTVCIVILAVAYPKYKLHSLLIALCISLAARR